MHHARLPHSAAWLVISSVGVLMLSAGAAQPAAQAPTAKPRTVWDGVYTEAQATRGTQAFGQSCTNCHTLQSQGNRPLTGDKFWEGWTQRSVADLLKFVSTNMPNGNGGTLSASTYTDLVSMILKSNGFPATTADLSPETAAGVQIVPKDGPGVLPAGTLVRIVGCLQKSGRDWTVTNATAPERVDKVGTGTEDASRTLGSGTVSLKFVLSRLDNFVGQRVSASGLLIGAGGADGLNVSQVNKVADACP